MLIGTCSFAVVYLLSQGQSWRQGHRSHHGYATETEVNASNYCEALLASLVYDYDITHLTTVLARFALLRF